MTTIVNYVSFSDPNMDFPLLQLQPPAFKSTVQNSNCLDIFHLAISSTKILQKLQYSRTNLREIWVNLSDYHSISLFGMNARNNWNGDVQWNFYKTISSAGIKENEVAWKEKLRFRGCTFEILEITNSNRLITICEDPNKTVSLAIQFLETIFRFPKQSILFTIDSDNFDPVECLDLKPWRSSRIHLRLKGFKPWKIDNFAFLVENLKLDSVMMVQASMETDCTYLKPIQIKTIRLSADWFTFDNLLSLSSQFVYLRAPQIDCSQLNTYISNWIRGDVAVDLKTLCINNVSGGIRFPEIVDGIFTSAMTKIGFRANDMDSVMWSLVENSEGFDVVRVTDRVRATVCWSGDKFMFHVRSQ